MRSALIRFAANETETTKVSQIMYKLSEYGNCPNSWPPFGAVRHKHAASSGGHSQYIHKSGSWASPRNKRAEVRSARLRANTSWKRGRDAPTQIWMHHNPPPRSLQLCGPNLSTVPISGLRVCSRVAVLGTRPRDAAGGGSGSPLRGMSPRPIPVGRSGVGKPL